MIWIEAILVVEAALILFVIGVWTMLTIVTKIHDRLFPYHPRCSIDPLEHSQFAWDKHGNGWIGKYKVISADRPRSHTL